MLRPLAKVNGFILVSECLPGIFSAAKFDYLKPENQKCAITRTKEKK
jgi:hypothetical protein